ncbi:tellurite resistance TerB family protein [Saccharothrix sp. NRRL B-16314]|uniref:tellurite resistance TerB family protein n=1 Tax=Saccharothrix sp. NRRL B-16314 TaxID=1463825 RepID=UPI000691DE84|nr:TerB N-terminal domain-containing protein [Saccharothrix sp. NRRL B-16314]
MSAPAWVPVGTTTSVAGRSLPGGMIYFGKLSRGEAVPGRNVEIIDPTLPIDWRKPDFTGQDMDYWPAYHSITPRSRAAYLLWLESGRWAPDTYIGFVFLYFYGLERRALVDAQRDPAARADLPRILGEVVRLLTVYGDNSSFRQYATEFQQVLRALVTRGEGPAPDPVEHDKWPPPLTLRVGIGRFAAEGRPVPVDWAWSWAMLHPEIYARTPATRCPNEFRALFATRYRARYTDGIKVRTLKSRVDLSYRPASGGLRTTSWHLDVPDVLTAAAPTKALKALIESCTDDLDAYSRLIGRQPEAAGTLPALALLPDELFTGDLDGLHPVRDLVDRTLPDDASQARFELADLTSLWPSRTPGKFAKAEAVGLAQLLDKFGIGIEPDVRMGAPVQSMGPAVLFRVTAAQPATTTPEYTAATTLLHLAAVVSAADDDVSAAERDHLISHLESSLHLTPGERVRLTAHLDWLLASKLKLTGLTKRLGGLTDAQRAHVAEFATAIAAVDGVVSPGEVDTLRKIYKLLGQEPDSVYTQLHALTAASTRPAPATEPVVVVPADTGPTGYLIPPPPKPEPPVGAVRLDPALVEAKMRESAAVAALLADVFDDDPEEAAPPPLAPVVAVDLVGSLDASHSTLLRELATRPSWSRADFDALCAGVRLLPEGALDVLNEAAVEAADEPVVEDDGDQLVINDYAMGELLA